MGEESRDILMETHPSFIDRIQKTLQQLGYGFTSKDIENSLDLGNSQGGGDKRFWAIDPIDGTKGYLRNDQYAVAISLIENGEVVVGVLGCPHLAFQKYSGGLFYALKDHGAFFNPFGGEILPLKVSQQQTEIIYCEPHSSSQSHSHTLSAKIAHRLHARPESFQMDSQCKYGLVASGQAAIYLRLPNLDNNSPDSKEKVWDHAAGSLIVEEAGGKVTDVFGQALNFSLGRTLAKNTGIIASNGWLHDLVIEAYQFTLRSC